MEVTDEVKEQTAGNASWLILSERNMFDEGQNELMLFACALPSAFASTFASAFASVFTSASTSAVCCLSCYYILSCLIYCSLFDFTIFRHQTPVHFHILLSTSLDFSRLRPGDRWVETTAMTAWGVRRLVGDEGAVTWW